MRFCNGLTSWALVPLRLTKKKIYFTNNLKMNHTKNTTGKLSTIRQWKKNCWKALDHSQNNFEGLTHWDFLPLGTTLTYTTSNLKNFRNCLEGNQYIDDNRWNNKNRNPWHDPSQTCGGSKTVCPVLIRPTEYFLTHPRTSFMINEWWTNKYDTNKSKINKRSLEQRTLVRF